MKKNDLDLAFSVIETAAVHLHNGLPLFLEGDLFAERNEWLRESLIQALLLSLDLLPRRCRGGGNAPAGMGSPRIYIRVIAAQHF